MLKNLANVDFGGRGGGTPVQPKCRLRSINEVNKIHMHLTRLKLLGSPKLEVRSVSAQF